MTVALLPSPIGARKSAKICHLWIINATEGELWKTLERGRPLLQKSPSIALVLEAGCVLWAHNTSLVAARHGQGRLPSVREVGE